MCVCACMHRWLYILQVTHYGSALNCILCIIYHYKKWLNTTLYHNYSLVIYNTVHSMYRDYRQYLSAIKITLCACACAMYVFVCKNACVYVCVFVCVCACVYVHACVHVRVHSQDIPQEWYIQWTFKFDTGQARSQKI